MINHADERKGLTYHGVTINHKEDVSYLIHINRKQSLSYLDCDSIANISRKNGDKPNTDRLRTICDGCSLAAISLINNLIGETVKSKLELETIEKLRWHLMQMISSQHYSGPISLR